MKTSYNNITIPTVTIEGCRPISILEKPVARELGYTALATGFGAKDDAILENAMRDLIAVGTDLVIVRKKLPNTQNTCEIWKRPGYIAPKSDPRFPAPAPAPPAPRRRPKPVKNWMRPNLKPCNCLLCLANNRGATANN